jgi:hypothetical protein
LRSIAVKIGRPVDEITFIGIHHRRTVNKFYSDLFKNAIT